MEMFITALHVALCFFLILIVLLQPGKGADLGAALGGGASSSVFGSAGSVSLLGKLTAAAAALFMITSLTLAYYSNRPDESVFSDFEVPAADAATPADAAAPAEEPAPEPAAAPAEAVAPDPVVPPTSEPATEATTEGDAAPATAPAAEGEPTPAAP